jgi:hypothetical protein
MLLLILCTVVIAGAIAYTASKKKQKATVIIETPVEVQPIVKEELPVVKEELPVEKEELHVEEKPIVKEKVKSIDKKTTIVKTQNKKAK